MRTTIFRTLSCALLSLLLSAGSLEAENWEIVVGRHASAMEQYAAAELQRYLYQLSRTLLQIKAETAGRPATRLGRWASANQFPARAIGGAGQLKVSEKDPGPQGYVLKRLSVDGRPMLAIAGSDAVGCLYGVYGLLEDHYGVGFYLGGDVLPEKSPPLRIPNVDERKRPAVAIRGFLPWTNFPQSATVYSWEDWKFILDQMAKMRMNFLHIHNYNETGLKPLVTGAAAQRNVPQFHLPRDHPPGVDGNGPERPFLVGAALGPVTQYRFGAGDLFDDYDFGADCALHNENLSNEQVFRKGVSAVPEGHRLCPYPRREGRAGLGHQPDSRRYKAKADDPEIVAARVDQIASDYPDLDYLLCFQSEGIAKRAEAVGGLAADLQGVLRGAPRPGRRGRDWPWPAGD